VGHHQVHVAKKITKVVVVVQAWHLHRTNVVKWRVISVLQAIIHAMETLSHAIVITAVRCRDAKLLVVIGMTSLFLVGALHATRRVAALEFGMETTMPDTVNGGHVKKLHVVQIIHAA